MTRMVRAPFCSLSLRERVGVRGRASTALMYKGPWSRGTGGLPLRSKDPLTPTLSRRERGQEQP